MPEGNYRSVMTLPEVVWMTDPTRVFLVDARGTREFGRGPEDLDALAEAYERLDRGWTVIEAGENAPRLTPLPEDMP